MNLVRTWLNNKYISEHEKQFSLSSTNIDRRNAVKYLPEPDKLLVKEIAKRLEN